MLIDIFIILIAMLITALVVVGMYKFVCYIQDKCNGPGQGPDGLSDW